MRRSCRAHRPAGGGLSFVVGPGEAVYLVHGLITRSPDRPSAFLWLDGRHRLIDLFAVDVGHHEVERVVEAMTEWPPSPVRAVVLGSPLPVGMVAPDDGELARIVDLRGRYERVAIDLLDWLVVGDDLVWSLAELTDSEERWL